MHCAAKHCILLSWCHRLASSSPRLDFIQQLVSLFDVAHETAVGQVMRESHYQLMDLEPIKYDTDRTFNTLTMRSHNPNWTASSLAPFNVPPLCVASTG